MISTALLTLFSGLLPFLPKIVDLFQRRMDNMHELEMFKMRMQFAEQEAGWRMEEIAANADVEEMKALHRPQPSYGVQLLDAAKASLPSWLLAPVFLLFGLVDFLNSTVRPLITYAVVGWYVAYKWARFDMIVSVSTKDLDWQFAVVNLWTQDDFTVLMMVLAYWFGHSLYRRKYAGAS